MGTSPVTLTIDIELTNRCNAMCSFCPRDAMPEQGVMQPEVFDQSLVRALEVQALAGRLATPAGVKVVFCGTGEPLVHRRVADCVARVRQAGLACEVATNGALLTRERSLALLDAGLSCLNVNVGELDADYERIYGLPFAATRDNLERFITLSRGRCAVCIILVDHRRDPEHLQAVERYWRSRGVDAVMRFGLVNRAGALAAPAVPSAGPSPRTLLCTAPFEHLFVGWDGRYYLCSSDWRKEVCFGSVFDTSFAAITADKLAHAAGRRALCARCTLDPANLLARRGQVADQTSSTPFDSTPAQLVENDRRVRALADEVMADTANPPGVAVS